MTVFKKILHFICFVTASAAWALLLALIYRVGFSLFYHLDIFSPRLHRDFLSYWNSGGTLDAKDLIMFLFIFLYIPVCFLVWYKLYHFKFMKLLTVPLNWLANFGSDKLKVKNVNIKNLVVEEKKTIDQLVQERLDKERKKQQNSEKNSSSEDFRKRIIEKIDAEKK